MAWTERDVNGGQDAGWGAGLMRVPVTGEASAPSPVERDNRPTLLLAAPQGHADDLVCLVEHAGFRCLGVIRPHDIAQRLTVTIAVDHIFVDLRDAYLDGENARALALRHEFADTRLSVITDLTGLDGALSQFDGPGTEFLCDPSRGDIVNLLVMAAIEVEQRRCNPQLNDSGRESEAGRMERLSEEVRRLATMVERLTQAGESNGAAIVAPDAGAPYRAIAAPEERPTERLPVGNGSSLPNTPSHGEIKALLRARRLREQYLPADLFADPAWDMILDLMAARLAGQRVSVSSLCIAASVPPTTALRWIRQLTERGVFSRIDDPADGRRVFIELTDEAAEAVMAWSLAVRRTGGLLPPA
jgi:hypothetical protein